MTPQNQQIAVLEKMGWTDIKVITPSQMYGKHPNPPPDTKVYLNDDYETSNLQSLDAIFAHLVPWMREQGWSYTINNWLRLETSTVSFFFKLDNQPKFTVTNKSLALAILECAVKALGLWKD